MQTYHLVPGSGGWNLSPEGSGDTLESFPSKEAAVQRCAELIKQHGGSLKIHDAGGQLEEERTWPVHEVPAETRA